MDGREYKLQESSAVENAMTNSSESSTHTRLDRVKANEHEKEGERDREDYEAGERKKEAGREVRGDVATVGDTAGGSTIDHQRHLRCKT